MWKNFQLAYTLKGHEQSVWAVLAIEGDDDVVLTGPSRVSSLPLSPRIPFLACEAKARGGGEADASDGAGAADNLVKLWKKDKSTLTFRGHTQAVRALARLDAGVGSGDLFASAGNDASVCLSLRSVRGLLP